MVAYLHERFPIGGVGLISVIFSLLAMGPSRVTFDQRWFTQVGLLALAFAAFLLRQRVTDEFKDKHHDDMNFPTRPFQRGLIDARSLIIMGALALITEITSVFLLGGTTSLLWYLPALAYSVLMAREFMMPRWLNMHFTMYFLLHEVIFVLFALWISKTFWTTPTVNTIAWAVAFTAVMMSIEVARKFELRRDSKETVVMDTYVAVWGRDNALMALQGLIMTAGIALAYTESSILFAVVSAAASICLNLFVLSDKLVKTIVAINLALLSLAGVLL